MISPCTMYEYTRVCAVCHGIEPPSLAPLSRLSQEEKRGVLSLSLLLEPTMSLVQGSPMRNRILHASVTVIQAAVRGCDARDMQVPSLHDDTPMT